MQYMPKHIQIGETPSHFPLYLHPKGAVNFCIWALKSLARSYGYAWRAFQTHLSKISSRRMDNNKEFRP